MSKRTQPHQLKQLLKRWALPPYLAVVDPLGSISRTNPPVSCRLLESRVPSQETNSGFTTSHLLLISKRAQANASEKQSSAHVCYCTTHEVHSSAQPWRRNLFLVIGDIPLCDPMGHKRWGLAVGTWLLHPPVLRQDRTLYTARVCAVHLQSC